MHPSISQAFDELQFGDNILNLRASLPTVEEGVFRAENWLRERQVMGARDVLIITGRGKNSPGGVSKLKGGVGNLLRKLQKQGLVESWKEHNPGSFAVVLAGRGR